MDLIGKNGIRDGIERGEYGEAQAYWIKKLNAELKADVSANFERIEARAGHRIKVLHGFAARDPTIEKMQTLVDVSSIFGDDAMPRVARALGQMQALGRLSAEELNQLTEAGINARRYLTEAFDMTLEELQKSQVSIEQIVDTIRQGLDADNSGVAARAQESWRGLKVTFFSYIEEIERKGMDAGVFDAMKAGLSDINEATKDWLDTNQDLIEQQMPVYLDKFTEAAGKTYDRINKIYGIYQAIPDEVLGAAGAGIIGRILFGSGTAGGIAAGVLALNETLISFNMDFASMVESYQAYHESVMNLVDVATGKRDWRTGAPPDPPARLKIY